MADLGAIGYSLETERSTTEPDTFDAAEQLGDDGDGALVSAALVADGDAVIMTSKPVGPAARVSQNYTVGGLTKVAGVNTSGITVRVFRRDTGLFLGETISGAGGAWSLTIIGYNGEVTCVAYDPAGGDDYNAFVYDKVIPD